MRLTTETRAKLRRRQRAKALAPRRSNGHVPDCVCPECDTSTARMVLAAKRDVNSVTIAIPGDLRAYVVAGLFSEIRDLEGLSGGNTLYYAAGGRGQALADRLRDLADKIRP